MAEAKERRFRLRPSEETLPFAVAIFHNLVKSGEFSGEELRQKAREKQRDESTGKEIDKYPPLLARPTTPEEQKRMAKSPGFKENWPIYRLREEYSLGSGVFSFSASEERRIQAVKAYVTHGGVRPAGTELRVPISTLVVQSNVTYPGTGVYSGTVAIFFQLDQAAVQTSTLLD